MLPILALAGIFALLAARGAPSASGKATPNHPWLYESGDDASIDLYRAMTADPLYFSLGDFALFVNFLDKQGFHYEADGLADLALAIEKAVPNAPDARYQAFPDLNPRRLANGNLNDRSYRHSVDWYGIPGANAPQTLPGVARMHF